MSKQTEFEAILEEAKKLGNSIVDTKTKDAFLKLCEAMSKLEGTLSDRPIDGGHF